MHHAEGTGKGGTVPLTKLRVKFWGDDGQEEYVGFQTMSRAREFYDSLAIAEIQKYNPHKHEYETVVPAIFQG